MERKTKPLYPYILIYGGALMVGAVTTWLIYSYMGISQHVLVARTIAMVIMGVIFIIAGFMFQRKSEKETKMSSTAQPYQAALTENKVNFCPNCGTPVLHETTFCTHCGKQI